MTITRSTCWPRTTPHRAAPTTASTSSSPSEHPPAPEPPRLRRRGWWVALGALALAWLPWLAPAQPTQPPFDLKDPAIIEAGRVLFNRRCAGRCHGRDGQDGFDGPILVGKAYLDRVYVWAALVTGRPGTAMPSWNGRLTDDELWQIIAFVAALGDQARAQAR
jgi:mono/diheme cytochrome c family protein